MRRSVETDAFAPCSVVENPSQTTTIFTPYRASRAWMSVTASWTSVSRSGLPQVKRLARRLSLSSKVAWRYWRTARLGVLRSGAVALSYQR